MRKTALALGVVIAMTAPAFSQSPTKVNTEMGAVVVGSNSYKTLYTFAGDSDGVSNCYDECAEKWPPHLAQYWDSPRPPFSTIERADGKKQWAKDGKPLYFSVLDEKKGDTNGDGVDGKWQAARP
jgi:predicted lipoprotein with Yx(FWY)xxD motif